MRLGFRIAICLLIGGCKFTVQPVQLSDASVGDLSIPDDLTVADSATPADFATPVDSALPPDSATPPDLLPADLTPPDLGPSCGDGVKNGSESAIDCGGSCPPCSDGRTCRGNSDCLSTHCLSGSCVECITGTQCGVPQEFCVQNVCDALTDGLVAYWNMDDLSWTNDCSTATVIDSTANHHDGLDCPAPSGGHTGPTAGAAGKFGTAGAFGPMEQHIDVPTSAAFNTGVGDFTISLWANFTSLAADTPVFESLPATDGHQVLIHHATTGWAFEQRPSGGSNTVIINQGAATTSLNVWHHIALVRASNNWTLYLDGTSIATATNTIAVRNTTGVVLGWSLDNSNQLNGFLDEYRFYNRTLSAAEIKAFSL